MPPQWYARKLVARLNKEFETVPTLLLCMSPFMAVRPEGANHLWRKIPPGELSIDPVADERLGGVTGRAGAS
jgi:hypothetical protein